MEAYLDFLTRNTWIIVKSNLVVLGILALSVIITLLLIKRYEKLSELLKSLLIIMCFVVLECGLLVIPRICDIQQQSFVVVENGSFYLDATNSTYEDGSVMFYGIGRVQDKSGKETLVLGANFFDLSNINSNDKYHATVVYAKHSRQVVKLEIKDRM